VDELPSLGDFIPGADVVEMLEQGLRVDAGDDDTATDATPADADDTATVATPAVINGTPIQSAPVIQGTPIQSAPAAQPLPKAEPIPQPKEGEPAKKLPAKDGKVQVAPPVLEITPTSVRSPF